jgi:hypothetical protein
MSGKLWSRIWEVFWSDLRWEQVRKDKSHSYGSAQREWGKLGRISGPVMDLDVIKSLPCRERSCIMEYPVSIYFHFEQETHLAIHTGMETYILIYTAGFRIKVSLLCA